MKMRRKNSVFQHPILKMMRTHIPKINVPLTYNEHSKSLKLCIQGDYDNFDDKIKAILTFN